MLRRQIQTNSWYFWRPISRCSGLNHSSVFDIVFFAELVLRINFHPETVREALRDHLNDVPVPNAQAGPAQVDLAMQEQPEQKKEPKSMSSSRNNRLSLNRISSECVRYIPWIIPSCFGDFENNGDLSKGIDLIPTGETARRIGLFPETRITVFPMYGERCSGGLLCRDHERGRPSKGIAKKRKLDAVNKWANTDQRLFLSHNKMLQVCYKIL